MKNNYPHIFEPLTIRRMTMKNRIMMTPMGTNYGDQNGEMTFVHIDYYEQRAKGGTGLLMVENASVFSPQGSNGTTQLRIDHDNFIPRLWYFCERMHKHGACVGIQINHAGASAGGAFPEGGPFRSPDQRPFGPAEGKAESTGRSEVFSGGGCDGFRRCGHRET